MLWNSVGPLTPTLRDHYRPVRGFAASEKTESPGQNGTSETENTPLNDQILSLVRLNKKRHLRVLISDPFKSCPRSGDRRQPTNAADICPSWTRPAAKMHQGLCGTDRMPDVSVGSWAQIKAVTSYGRFDLASGHATEGSSKNPRTRLQRHSRSSERDSNSTKAPPQDAALSLHVPELY